MYYHRTYIEKSDDFLQMCLLVEHLNGLSLCDWSLGRLFGWRYGRWSEESQIDSVFEKQAELFFDALDRVCGIVITENFGESYYLLSESNDELLQMMLGFIECSGCAKRPYSITVSMKDECQKKVLEGNGFVSCGDVDVTYRYALEDIVLPCITVPEGFAITSQREYLDVKKVEKLRFFAFNPDSRYNLVVDKAYEYARKNPIIVPELCIVVLNEKGEPVSTCTGLLDKRNKSMEVEIVATKKEYENRGLAKLAISKCIENGLNKGVKEIVISAWNEKTRRLYSSFGRPQEITKVCYQRKSVENG